MLLNSGLLLEENERLGSPLISSGSTPNSSSQYTSGSGSSPSSRLKSSSARRSASDKSQSGPGGKSTPSCTQAATTAAAAMTSGLNLSTVTDASLSPRDNSISAWATAGLSSCRRTHESVTNCHATLATSVRFAASSLHTLSHVLTTIGNACLTVKSKHNTRSMASSVLSTLCLSLWKIFADSSTCGRVGCW